MAVGYTVGWGRKVRQGRMWLDVVGYRIGLEQCKEALVRQGRMAQRSSVGRRKLR